MIGMGMEVGMAVSVGGVTWLGAAVAGFVEVGATVEASVGLDTTLPGSVEAGAVARLGAQPENEILKMVTMIITVIGRDFILMFIFSSPKTCAEYHLTPPGIS
jgi:hypothetical protein